MTDKTQRQLLNEVINELKELIPSYQDKGLDTYPIKLKLDHYQRQLNELDQANVNELDSLQAYEQVNYVSPSKQVDVKRHPQDINRAGIKDRHTIAINTDYDCTGEHNHSECLQAMDWSNWIKQISLQDFDEFMTLYIKKLSPFNKFKLFKYLLNQSLKKHESKQVDSLYKQAYNCLKKYYNTLPKLEYLNNITIN